MVILLMFLYSDQYGGVCVCNIMSRMSGHVHPQSFMILNVFTIMFDRVHMQSQSFKWYSSQWWRHTRVLYFSFLDSIWKWDFFSAWFFCSTEGNPCQNFSENAYFWLPLSNEGSHRCSGVFVFEIIAFKVFNFLLQDLVTCGTIFIVSQECCLSTW